MRVRYDLVCFSRERDDWGLYVYGRQNDFGTSLMFRGTFEEVLAESREVW